MGEGTARFGPGDRVMARITRGVEIEALPLIASGAVTVPIDARFPLADAAEAHARMETSQHIGKIVLTL